MKKSKRENLLSPSSSWRENSHPPRRNSNAASVSDVGCLPGFFHLLFHNRRKSLTFGSKKAEQRTVVCASPAETTSDAPPPGDGEAARMSLVGALEKCDRDLEELRRTIDVIKTTFFLHQKLPVAPPETVARDNLKVSDAVGKRTAEEDKGNIKRNVMRTEMEVGLTRNQSRMRKRSSSSSRRSTDMVESVNQVCDDVAWGQRRELGIIGLALQDHICRDLIDDTLRHLSSSTPPFPVSLGRHRRRRSASGLPLDACRRSLVFS